MFILICLSHFVLILNVFLRNAAWSTHAAAPGGYSAYEGISPSRSPGNLPFHKWISFKTDKSSVEF